MEVSGDSIMGLLMLAAGRGTSIDVTVEGAEAEAARRALRALVADRFGEPTGAPGRLVKRAGLSLAPRPRAGREAIRESRMRSRLIAIALALATLASPAAAETIRVGMSGGYFPFTFVRADELQGFEVDFMNAVAERDRRHGRVRNHVVLRA